MAGKWNIKIDLGATWTRMIFYEDSRGNRIDLTGYSARMEIRNKQNGAVVLATLSTTNGTILLESADYPDDVGETQGVIRLSLPANATDDITTTTGYYDLKLYPPGADEIRLLQGSVTFNKATTIDG